MPPKSKPSAAAPADVDALLASLDHPRDAEIRALRRLVLAADATIAEGIKWNAPSFRTSEWFATTHLRAKDGVQLILHFGARRRDDLPARGAIADPAGLLAWLADDRASVTFRDLAELEARRDALTALVRAWIAYV